MDGRFDPYHQWLAIPPAEQPPHLYRLLGVKPFESNPDVIESAADQRINHLRMQCDGPHGQVAERLIAKLSEARNNLLDADRRAAYDEKLRARAAAHRAMKSGIGQKQHPAQALPASKQQKKKKKPKTRVAATQDDDSALAGLYATAQSDPSTSAIGRHAPPPPKKLPLAFLIGGGSAVLVLGILLAWVFLSGGSNTAEEDVEDNGTPGQTAIALDWSPEDRQDVSVMIDDAQHPFPSEGPLTYVCLPGEHKLVATRAGYHPMEETIEVKSGETFKLSANWRPKAMLILDWPAAERGDASLELDGKPHSLPTAKSRVTEAQVQLAVEPGSHRLKITRASYRPFEKSVQIKNGGLATIAPVWLPATVQPPVDLLSLIKPDVHTRAGKCWFDQSKLVMPNGPPVKVEIPYQPPQEYILKVVASREQGTSYLRLGLYAGTSFEVLVDGNQGAGMQLVNRQRYDANPTRNSSRFFTNGQSAELTCIVRSTGVRLSFDDQVVFDWRGSLQQLSPGDAPTTRILIDKSQNTAFHITKIELTPITGQGRIVDSPSSQPTIPTPMTDPLAKTKPMPDPKVEALVKRPLPPTAEREKIVAQIVEAYGTKQADTAQKRLDLAERMLRDSEQVGDNAAEQFALLVTAMELARDAGNSLRMFAIADVIGANFEVSLAQVKAHALSEFPKRSRDEAGIAGLVSDTKVVIADAVREDRYDLAKTQVQGLIEACRRSEGRAFRDEVNRLRKQLAEQETLWTSVQEAATQLAAEPDDQAANLLVGRWHALVKGDWQRGLPYLAKGSDAAIAELAAAELAGPPADATQRFQLGSGWWKLAEKETGPAIDQLRLRAAGHFRAAQPQLSGLPRRLVEERLAELEESSAAGPDLPGLPAKNAGMFAGRAGPAKQALLQHGGGTPETEAAVEAALEWIAEHQFPDGGWSFDHGSSKCQGRCSNGGNMAIARNAATGMALLCFMGAGETHKEGEHKQAIQAGLSYLGSAIKLTKEGGRLNERDGKFYSHAIATLALCEAYGMTKDRRLQGPAQAAVNYIIYAQSPTLGGWRYEPRKGADTSVTGWQVVALKTADAAGLSVPANTAAGITQYLNFVQADAGAAYGYDKPGASNISMTAAGLLCRMYLGWPHDHEPLGRGVERLAGHGPNPKNMYYNYYATQVVRHFGGAPWKRWNERMQPLLLRTQSKDGHTQGSWYMGAGAHNEKGGRLYCTALATLMLQSYYRHLPLYLE